MSKLRLLSAALFLTLGGITPIAAGAGNDVVIAHASDIANWQPRPADAADALLVSPGGTLNASVEAQRTNGAFAADCLATQGYGAVNLVPGDFAKGLAAIKPLLKAEGPFVSANLTDRAGNRVAPAYVILAAGSHKVGVTGVTLAPAADDPASKAFAADLTAADPVESLKTVAAELATKADVRVLLVYGNVTSAAAVARAYPQFQLCLNSSGMAGSAVAHVGTAALAQSPSGGQSFGLTVLPDGNPANATTKVASAPLFISAAIQKVYDQHHVSSNPVDLVPQIPAAAQVAENAPVPDKFPESGVLPMNRSAANRGVKLTATMARVAGEYGKTKAAPGSSFLVLTTSWENIIPLTLVARRQIPTEYVVPNLPDNLYLVVNGARVAQVLPDVTSLPGHLPTKPLKIEKLGQVVRGNVVFVLPPEPVTSLELRFYDFAHGHFAMPIVGAAPSAADKPVSPPQKNEVIEAAIFAVTKPDAIGGKPAPPGMRYVAIDLRARSALSTKADATAFDPKAGSGDTIEVGTVADWQESRKYAQLVADGRYAYLPLAEGSELAPQPRFLPDLMTGGTLAFLVPTGVQSLELRCDFPNAKLPGGRIIRPGGLLLPAEGKRPELASAPALGSARDGVFDVAITGSRSAPDFEGIKASEGKKFLVLDVTVKNLNTQQEFFQPKAQLKYASESGATVESDPASAACEHPAYEQIYIPAGAARSFRVAYQIASGESRPRLAYGAVTAGGSKVLSLPRLGTDAVATGQPAQAPEPVRPAAPVTPQPMKPDPPVVAPQVAKTPQPPAVVTPGPGSTKGPKIAALPRQHGEPRGIQGVGLTAEQVNAAIDKGARALWEKRQQAVVKKHEPFGALQEDTLVALALVHADAHKKVPEFDRALRHFLSTVKVPELGAQARGTYEVGLLAMLLQAYGDPEFESQTRQAARWLLEAEGADGTWTYSASLPEELFKQLPGTGVLQISGGLPPGTAQGDAWQRQTKAKVIGGDNSVTQFAILGMQSAAASGIKFPAEAWQHALDMALKRQSAEDGAWDYHDAGRGYGSMTSAGVCAVAIGRFQTGAPDYTQGPAIDRGVAWLDQHFAVGSHPNYGNPSDYAYYFMYSLERVGRILDTEFIGAHEWYPEGAAWLVANQQAGGMWVGKAGEEKEQPELATSFALLFLTRATPPLKPQVKHGPGTLRTAVIAPDNRFYIILDASGSMLDTMDGQMKFDIARGAVQSLIDSLPPNSEVALRVYGHRKRAIEPGSDLDTELKIPMSQLDARKFTQTLNALRSRGKTPLALSIEDTIHDLGEIPEDKPVTLILLTDGGEDTTNPRGNPLKAAEDLGKVKNIRFHIVGFDINVPDWSQQLQEMARRSGGRYWPAARSADLQRSLRNAVLGIPEQFQIIDADGHEASHGAFGDSPSLPPGKYQFRTLFAGQTFDQPFYVSSGEVTSVTFDASQVPPGAPQEATAAPQPPAAPAEPAAPAAKAWPKFCTHCGAPLTPGQKFCSKCGTKVEPK